MAVLPIDCHWWQAIRSWDRPKAMSALTFIDRDIRTGWLETSCHIWVIPCHMASRTVHQSQMWSAVKSQLCIHTANNR